MGGVPVGRIHGVEKQRADSAVKWANDDTEADRGTVTTPRRG